METIKGWCLGGICPELGQNWELLGLWLAGSSDYFLGLPWFLKGPELDCSSQGMYGGSLACPHCALCLIALPDSCLLGYPPSSGHRGTLLVVPSPPWLPWPSLVPVTLSMRLHPRACKGLMSHPTFPTCEMGAE
jgi:hypothetical protein